MNCVCADTAVKCLGIKVWSVCDQWLENVVYEMSPAVINMISACRVKRGG